MRKMKKYQKSPPARLRYPLKKTIALVGLMGSGKTTVGKRLARRLAVDFVDSDEEIEKAAGYSVSEIFEKFGEEDFRDGERRVISRLIDGDVKVLGTGGGAFMDAQTRKLLKSDAITIWLKADIKDLVERTGRRDTRPLLRQGNPEQILRDLAQKRYPIYGQANITIETGNGPHEYVVNSLIHALNRHLAPDENTSSKKSAPRKKKYYGKPHNKKKHPYYRRKKRDQAVTSSSSSTQRDGALAIDNLDTTVRSGSAVKSGSHKSNNKETNKKRNGNKQHHNNPNKGHKG